jgi:hypothetical protein
LDNKLTLKIEQMKNLSRKLSYTLYILLATVFLIGCTYEKDGKIVKDTDGKIYRLEGNGRTSEAYHLIEIDTTNYEAKFK